MKSFVWLESVSAPVWSRTASTWRDGGGGGRDREEGERRGRKEQDEGWGREGAGGMRGGREMHSARLSVTATLCCILSLHKHRAIFMYQNDPSHELLYFPPACISSFPIHSVHAYFKLRQRRDSRPELPSRLLIHNYVRLHRTLMMIILQPSKTSHSSSVRRPPFCSPLPVSCFSHVPLLFPTFLISSKLLLFLPTITSPSAQSVPPPESGCKHF